MATGKRADDRTGSNMAVGKTVREEVELVAARRTGRKRKYSKDDSKQKRR
jgi:hypothetical protein